MKRIFLLLISFSIYGSAIGCDLCGCFTGVLPNTNASFIGTRVRYRTFSGEHHHASTSGSASSDETSRETYISTDLMGRYFIRPRLNVTAYLPYAIGKIQSDEGTVGISGIGDPTVLLQYTVLRSKPACDSVGWKYTLFAGGGFKAPLGGFRKAMPDGDIDPHAQPGTGSWDGLLTTSFFARHGKVGLSLDGTARFNTANPDQYRFGNRFNSTMHLLYWFQKGSFMVLPQLGTYTEIAAPDRMSGMEVEGTGGASVFASGGVDVFYKNLSWSTTVQHPVAEYLGDEMPANHTRLISGLIYYF
jgi:hypothetical protein